MTKTYVPDDPATENAVFGGGCFWCLEAVFQRIDGVVSVVSGYAGGGVDSPSYEDVCTGNTGHAEVVRVEFDPAMIGFERLLDIFFRAHDPTTLNRQGADTGTQYRSIILYRDADQKDKAEEKIKELDRANIDGRPAVTEVAALDRFWEAEEHHQEYYEKHPFAGYCRVVIAPKLQKIGLKTEAVIS